MATTAELITQLYVGYYNRAPDPEGLNYWIGRANAGVSMADIANSFAASPEAIATYPYLAFPNVANAETFLEQVYQNLFNRSIDADGREYYANKLATGQTTPGQIIAEIQANANTNPNNTDGQVLANKVTVGLDFALEASATPGFEYEGAAVSQANTVLDSVTDDQASVDAALASNDSFFENGGGLPEPTFTLTTGVDNVTGTAADDTIVGTVGATALSSTFNSGDTINGGAGFDTLQLIIGGDANTITPARLTNVERIEVQDFDGDTTVNLANATGVEILAASGSESTTTFTNVRNLVDVELTNIDNGVGLDIEFAASAVAGANTAINALIDSSDAMLDVDGVETLNVTSTGEVFEAGRNTLEIDSDIVTLNIAGEGNLEVVDLRDSLRTVDASAATGNISLDLTFADEDTNPAVTVTGGSGDDFFNFGATLTAADVVNGGAGFDAVRVDTATELTGDVDAGDFSSAANAARFNALTSVEQVQFVGSEGVTLNGATFTNAGITNILFNTDNDGEGADDVVNNAGSARTYEFGTANNGSATFRMNGTSTVLNIALLGTVDADEANAGVDADIDGLTVELSGTAPAGTVATINIDSQGDLPDVVGADGDDPLADDLANDVGVIDVVAGSTINITGAGNLTIDELANRGVINASTATGNLVIEGSEFVEFEAAVPPVLDAEGDVVSPGSDAVAFVSGADVITLGAGQDTVQFSSGFDSGVTNTTSDATEALGLQIDVINGFTAGANGDVLDFAPAAEDADADAIAAADANYTALSATAQAAINALSGEGATLEAAADIAVRALAQETGDDATDGEWTAFTFQGQTYAVYDDADETGGEGFVEGFVEGTDLLVQITGVNVADLTDANFA